MDQPAHVLDAGGLIVQVKAQGAATSRPRRLDQRYAEPVEHSRSGSVDRRRECRLHAAGERKHFARVSRLRPCARRARSRRDFFAQRSRQNAAKELPRFQRSGEEHSSRQRESEYGPAKPVQRSALGPRLDEVAADVDEPAVLHARRARSLAGAARQAAIQVQARALGDLPALERALHEVDAAARRIEVVAEKLVGRAGRGAKPAVHAFAQDGFGF
jgi:hypothetical protein